MRVFRHLMVVGVGAAITFSNVGRSSSTPPPTQPQDSPSESNQLEFGQDFKSAPKTKRERKSQEGYIPVVSPPTHSQKDSTETQEPQLGSKVKSASQTALKTSSSSTSSQEGQTQTQEPQLGSKVKSASQTALKTSSSSTSSQEGQTQTQEPQLGSKVKSASQTTLKTSSSSTPSQEGQTQTQEPQLGSKVKSASQTALKKKSRSEEFVASTSTPRSSADKEFTRGELSFAFKTEVQENLKSAQKTEPEEKAHQEQAIKDQTATGVSPNSPAEVKPVNRLSEIAQAGASTSAPLQSFPSAPPNGTLQTKPPNYLDPNPNPLQFPTEPGEVRVEGTQPITLQQAIDLARRNSQTVQIAETQLKQSRAVLQEQRSALYPDLTLQMDLSHSLSASGDLSLRAEERQAESVGRPFEGRNYSNNSLNSNLQLSYNVDLFGATSANIQAAKERVRGSELEVERLVEELRFDVTTAYYNLQDADGRVAISEAAVRNAQKSLQDAEALERAGVGTRFAVLQAQVNRANEQQRLNEARRDQQIQRRSLTELLNVNPSVTLTAADPVEQAGVWGRTLEESIVLAFKNRAELEQQLVQRDLSKQQRRAILAGRLPQLQLSAAYNVLASDPGDPGRFVPRGWADGYSLRATLSWNIFDGGAAKARAQQRDADIAISETRFEQLRNQIRREVEQAYFELESSFASIETAEAGVEQAREALRLARLRFQAGVGTQTDVIQAETDLTRAERNRLLAIIGYNRALSSLQRAVSNLPGNDLSDTP